MLTHDIKNVTVTSHKVEQNGIGWMDQWMTAMYKIWVKVLFYIAVQEITVKIR